MNYRGQKLDKGEEKCGRFRKREEDLYGTESSANFKHVIDFTGTAFWPDLSSIGLTEYSRFVKSHAVSNISYERYLNEVAS